MKILQMNVGRPVEIPWQGKMILTGIKKDPVLKPLFLSRLQLESDGQGDTVNHGGEDKAACVYAAEHYPYWKQELQFELPEAAFGENFTVEGLAEDKVHIGDIFTWGDALVQISQPRQPCYKLAARHGIKEFPVLLRDTGYTGYYLRVLEEGTVAPGDQIERVETDERKVTVAEANRIMYHDTKNEAAAQMLLAVPALADAWREPLEKRIEKMKNQE
ncbi:MOSC domain-containing protein [Alkalicoccus daliensis]|uniref:MOSC domain-containing protein YiiM n=1 Tax=Alkalicoccus daliensis TaxID=745820 RepID=A0A1H0KNY8_9BACI|nr:MOSC domain-containing protein [Alkalicoccus daliensis]SDO57658.1 MOSC domain-containing protein YiiM [Alkalicoccus daliensis]